MDISVIVPIYGVENYIEKCLRSLFEQTKTDGVEFILVNDCTPDGSMMIVSKMIAEHSHLEIKIIDHTENKGLAATRQTGFDIAKGDYIIHIDSDDWCELNMLEEMYDKAIEENADIVVCDFLDEYYDHEVYRDQSAIENKKYSMAEILFGNKVFGYLWCKLIRRSLYIDNNLKWIEGCNLCEDLLMTWRLFFLTKKIIYFPKAFLHYVHNKDSISRNENVKTDESVLRIYGVLYDFYKNQIFDPDPLDLFTDTVTRMILNRLRKKYKREDQRLFASYIDKFVPQIKQCQCIKSRYRVALYLASTGHLYLLNIIWDSCDLFWRLKGKINPFRKIDCI